MLVRNAKETDAPAMGRVMVDTYLRAHQGQVPQEAWRRRQEEWTPEVSAANWARTIRAIVEESDARDCIYVALETVAEQEELAGLSMGGPSGVAGWEQAGEVYALYVAFNHQGRGVGRALIRAAVGHLRPLGMTELIIRCLSTNVSGNRFYTALGGQLAGESDGDEYGYRTLEYIYHWADNAVLLKNAYHDH